MAQAPQSPDTGLFPVAQPITTDDFTPNPEGPELPPGFPRVPGQPPLQFPPRFHVCNLSLPQGCYQLNITTTASSPKLLFRSFKLGTLRVEKNGAAYVISGDTYRYNFFDFLSNAIPSFGPTEIPIYPRSRYGSYLKATSVSVPRFSVGPCLITLQLDEYDYTQPPAGSFDGTFATAPSRSLTVSLTPATAPGGFTGAYFTGQVHVGGVLQSGMSVTLAWVHPRYRKATVEIHTMTGSVAPAAVGTEFFDTVYADANWEMTVKTDPNAIPAPTQAAGFPAGWTGTSNWGSNTGIPLLHKLMTNLLDFASVNLDKVWYTHLLMVPASMGDGRGIMFDTINVPREGVASFSDDGYPTSDSANFGSAANKKQRDVPRGFLRSAAHEITHGFNQIHQENEGGADNSIMTTSPGVADYLAGHGGAYPKDIFLGFNDHVRHHLKHLPDIVIRPGGMTWTAGHNGIPVPQADADGEEMFTEHPAIDLKLTAKQRRVKLGEPLQLDWALQNISDKPVWLPGDLSVAGEFAEVSVTKPSGDLLEMPPYFIKCDSAFFTEAKPQQTVAATHQLFWSTQGFAFETPGKHTVNLEISWGSGGALVGRRASVDVFVDYPISESENEVVAHMITDDVGKFVALGGHAYHLKSAVEHIEAARSADPDHPACRAMAGYCHANHEAKPKEKSGATKHG